MDAALQALADAGMLAAKHSFERLASFCAAEKARLLLRLSRPEQAMRAARPDGASVAKTDVQPETGVTSGAQARALMWVSWAEARNRLDDALDLAMQWRSFSATAGAVRSALRWDIRIAHLSLLAGEIRNARRAFRRALELAAPGRYLRSFLDEPQLVGTLMADRNVVEEPKDQVERFSTSSSAPSNMRAATRCSSTAPPTAPMAAARSMRMRSRCSSLRRGA